MENEKEFLEFCINHFGEDKQQMVAIEEMAELTQALSKMIIDHPKKSREAVVEEYADVSIMLGQLKIIYNITDDEVEEIKKAKLSRLAKAVGYPNNILHSDLACVCAKIETCEDKRPLCANNCFMFTPSA